MKLLALLSAGAMAAGVAIAAVPADAQRYHGHYGYHGYGHQPRYGYRYGYRHHPRYWRGYRHHYRHGYRYRR